MADPAAKTALLNKQKQERKEVEQKLKKAKGLMKGPLEEQLDGMEAKHAAELEELTNPKKKAGSAAAEEEEEPTGGYPADGAGKKKKKEKKDKGDASSSAAKESGGASSSSAKKDEDAKKDDDADFQIFKERQWNGMSKTEMEECCTERGLSKKGKKEDLTMRLITFHQEQASNIKEDPSLVEKAKRNDLARRKKEQAEEDGDVGSDDDDDDDSDSEDDDAGAAMQVTAEQAEKQFEREKIVRKKVLGCLKQSGPIPLEELPKVLDEIGKVKSFTPQICGYSSLRQFAKNQPSKYMVFNKKTNMVSPPPDT